MRLARPPAGPARRLAFAGTPQIAADTLAGLLDAGFEVDLVVSRADKRRGRRGEPIPSPVKALALERGIPVSHDPADLATAGVDVGVVVAFGRIIRRPVLEAVPLCNIHFSLLPRWRGAAPVERAILTGDAVTGVCLMAVDEGLDTGGVYDRVVTEIRPGETAGQLRNRLGDLGIELLVDKLRSGLGEAQPQRGEASYADKISHEDLHLDWALTAAELERVVRVGRAWTTWRGKRLLVLDAELGSQHVPGPPGALDSAGVSCGAGTLVLKKVQAEGKAPLDASAWLRGARPGPGDRLGE